MNNKIYGKQRRNQILLVVSCLLVCILIVLSLIDFQKKMTDESGLQVNMRLREITLQMGESIRHEMEDCQVQVESLVGTLSASNDPIDDSLIPLLKVVGAHTAISCLSVITEHNDVITDPDSVTRPFPEQWFASPGFYGDEASSDFFVSGVTGENALSLYSPVMRDGRVVAVVSGIIPLVPVQHMLSFSGFDGESHSYLLRSDGITFLSALHDNTVYTQVDFFDLLSKETSEASMSADYFRQNIQGGYSGFLHYTIDAAKLKAFFSPVGFRDWYIISILPEKVSTAFGEKLYGLVVNLMIRIVVCVLAILACILLWIESLRKKIEQSYDYAVSSNKKFEIAIKHTKCLMFEYDVQTDTLFNISEELQKMLGMDKSVHTLRLGQYVDRQFLQSERSKIKKLITDAMVSADRAECELEKQDGGWMRMTLSPVRQIDGLQLVGTMEDITVLKKAEQHYIQEEQYFTVMLEESLTGISLDLDTGKILLAYRPGETRIDVKTDILLDDELLERMCGVIHPDYRSKVYKMYKNKELRQIHARGIKEISEQFLIKPAGSDEYLWVVALIHFLTNPSTGHAIVFSYIKNVDEKKRHELELEYQSQRDGLTGLFNRITFARKMNTILQHASDDLFYALFMLDLDGFKNINDVYGHQAGDRLLCSVSLVLEAVAEGSQHCFAGRHGGDEFAVFMYGIESSGIIIEAAENLCRTIEKMSLEDNTISLFTASIGVTYRSTSGDTFDTMYTRADKSLYRAKHEGKNRVCFSETINATESCGTNEG